MKKHREIPRRYQFGTKALFALVFLVALLLVTWQNYPTFFLLTLGGIVLRNLLGLIVGLLVTYLLRLPNDGSLTWTSNDEDDTR